MKLQRHFAYKYKDKMHYKHVIIVPEETLSKLGWGTGIELKQETKGNALIIKPIELNLNRRKENDRDRRE
jgi:bifunctional DNA-binding transcriptional regulator/antitoxin component of YhaV-PrlF toxin-antitoxin module